MLKKETEKLLLNLLSKPLISTIENNIDVKKRDRKIATTILMI